MSEAVCSGGLRYPGFRLVKAGEQLRAREYTIDIPWRPTPFTGTAEVERVLAEWERGATIVLQGLHLTRPPLAAFCRSLEERSATRLRPTPTTRPARLKACRFTTTPTTCSCSRSPVKRWLVYEPALELPLKNQRYSPELGGPGEVSEDLVLRRATCSTSRGWLHEALLRQRLLHLTIGVNVVTWLDAFKAALEEARRRPGFGGRGSRATGLTSSSARSVSAWAARTSSGGHGRS